MRDYILTLDEAQTLLAKRDAEIERLNGELQTVHAHLQHYRNLVDQLRADKAELLAALREAADVIQDLDGGNPATNTGWATSEALDAWMDIRAAIAKVSK